MATRSLLFTPGDEPEMMRKSLDMDADVIIFDLEDAVSQANKEIARERIPAALEESTEAAPDVWVRINPLETGGDDDIEALAAADVAPEHVIVPMVETVDQLETAAERFAATGLESGIVALVETAAGLTAVEDLVTQPDVTGVVFGAEDFTADMGIIELDDRRYLDYARSRIAVAGSSADVLSIDTVYTDLGNTEGLRADARQALNFGFDGKAAIHPNQIDTITEVFTPSEEKIEWAEGVLEARDAAGDKGVFEYEGEMIDAPVLARAEEIIRRTGE
jgi:citrate lyase subunit beta/citryl-CoA lyase